LHLLILLDAINNSTADIALFQLSLN